MKGLKEAGFIRITFFGFENINKTFHQEVRWVCCLGVCKTRKGWIERKNRMQGSRPGARRGVVADRFPAWQTVRESRLVTKGPAGRDGSGRRNSVRRGGRVSPRVFEECTETFRGIMGAPWRLPTKEMSLHFAGPASRAVRQGSQLRDHRLDHRGQGRLAARGRGQNVVQ